MIKIPLNVMNLISEIPLFKGLEASYLEQIGALAMERRLGKGEIIFFEGDDSNGFYVVAEGQIKIYMASVEGKEQILHFMGPGEPFGEVAVFSGRKFPATAQAVAPVLLLFFPKDKFIDLITRQPMLALNMLAILSYRLRQFTLQVEALSLKEVPARLAAHLILLAAEQPRASEVLLNISKGQLAGLLGTIPETLSRVFARMSDQNLIQVDGPRIKLLNPKGLAEVAEFGKILE